MNDAEIPGAQGQTRRSAAIDQRVRAKTLEGANVSHRVLGDSGTLRAAAPTISSIPMVRMSG
jgi:hypothetical protein